MELLVVLCVRQDVGEDQAFEDLVNKTIYQVQLPIPVRDLTHSLHSA